MRMDRKPVEVDEDVEDHGNTLVVGICTLIEMKSDHDGFKAFVSRQMYLPEGNSLFLLLLSARGSYVDTLASATGSI